MRLPFFFGGHPYLGSTTHSLITNHTCNLILPKTIKNFDSVIKPHFSQAQAQISGSILDYVDILLSPPPPPPLLFPSFLSSFILPPPPPPPHFYTTIFLPSFFLPFSLPFLNSEHWIFTCLISLSQKFNGQFKLHRLLMRCCYLLKP